MSTSAPSDPVQPTPDDGGRNPDRPEETDAGGPAATQSETPFRTPDPAEVGPEPTGNPVDPAVSTTTPDPGQTGRDQR